MTVAAPLVLAAHGSADPRFSRVVEEIAALVAELRPGLDVRVGYLEHGPPSLAEVADAASVVVPLLLSGGFHRYADLPAQAPGCVITAPVGPDPRLADVLADRLRAAGWQGEGPVVLAATGSADPRSLADVALAADQLSGVLDVAVRAAYLSAGEPRLSDLAGSLTDGAVATYLLAPGHFAEVAARCGARIVAAPLGADPRVAAIALDRYDAARLPLSSNPPPHDRIA